MKADKRSHARRVQPISQGSPSLSDSVQERFARAIFAGDRSDLDQILLEIAKLSSPSDSPEEFLRLMASLLIHAARCVVKRHMVREELRDLALTDDLTGLHNRRGFFALAGQQIKIARRNHRWALLFFAEPRWVETDQRSLWTPRERPRDRPRGTNPEGYIPNV